MTVEEVRQLTAETAAGFSLEELQEGAKAAYSQWAGLARKTVLSSRDCGKWLHFLHAQVEKRGWAEWLRKAGIHPSVDARFRKLYTLQKKLNVSDADLVAKGLVKGLDYLKDLSEESAENPIAQDAAAVVQLAKNLAETAKDGDDPAEDETKSDITIGLVDDSEPIATAKDGDDESEEDDTVEDVADTVDAPSEEIANIAVMLEVLDEEMSWAFQTPEEVANIAAALERLGEAVEKIADNINKHWEKIKGGKFAKIAKPSVATPRSRMADLSRVAK